LTRSGLQAAATTNLAHGYSNGDVITIGGVIDHDTGVGAEFWNGTFVIYNASGSNFNYYMLGTPNDNIDLGSNSTASKVLAFRLDAILTGLSGATHVHLGPTTATRPFLTRGYAEGIGGWQIKGAMRISGSGMGATTLQLIPQEGASAQFYAIAHALTTGSPAVANPMDFCEVLDMTIDCNAVARTGITAAGDKNRDGFIGGASCGKDKRERFDFRRRALPVCAVRLGCC